MRAFSSKKYTRPRVEVDSLVLSSIDGAIEVRVFEAIKFITPDNKSVVYKPSGDSAKHSAKVSV